MKNQREQINNRDKTTIGSHYHFPGMTERIMAFIFPGFRYFFHLIRGLSIDCIPGLRSRGIFFRLDLIRKGR